MPIQDTRFHSPLRVFEKALDGGLGAGQVGVVLSRRGVGKTALLVGMAVDALLQGRRVLHISTEETVTELQRFYAEVFKRMAESLKLDHRMQHRLDMERNRHILVYNRKEFSLENRRLPGRGGRLPSRDGDHGRHAAFRAHRAVGDRRGAPAGR